MSRFAQSCGASRAPHGGSALGPQQPLLFALPFAVLLGVVFAALARRLPETPVARLSLGAMSAMKAHAGFAVEALTVHSSARVVLFRHRRELVELLGRRTDAARALGEAVYAGEKDETKEELGTKLHLPPWFKDRHDEIIASLEPIQVPETAIGAPKKLVGPLTVYP